MAKFSNFAIWLDVCYNRKKRLTRQNLNIFGNRKRSCCRNLNHAVAFFFPYFFHHWTAVRAVQFFSWLSDSALLQASAGKSILPVSLDWCRLLLQMQPASTRNFWKFPAVLFFRLCLIMISFSTTMGRSLCCFVNVV